MDMKKMMYVIDDEYHILYRNKVFQELYPQITCGQICYEALGGRSEVCPHCPLVKDNRRNTFFNIGTSEWINAQESEIEWEGKEGCHALFCKIWKGEKENEEDGKGIVEEDDEFLREFVSANDQMMTEMRQIQRHLESKNRQKNEVILALSQEYGNVYSVSAEDGSFDVYRLEDYVAKNVSAALRSSDTTFADCIEAYIKESVYEDDSEKLDYMLSMDNVCRELNHKKMFFCNYRTCREGRILHYQVKCFRINDEVPIKRFIIGFRNVDLETRREMDKQQALADALAQAKNANNAKTDFLNNMSHDIRTPLNAIIGMTTIALMHMDEKDRVRDALNKVMISSRHLLGLINSVLDMSKIESGKISLNEDEFKISDSINTLINLFHSQMKAKDLELKVNIGRLEHEDVIGDEQRLSQIFNNILSNSVKYTPGGGTVSLSINERPSNVAGMGSYEFVFEDTGIGMSREFIDKIFEPFTRETETETARVEGTGLGMAIALNVAKLMGGDIKVDSELGKGSRFVVKVHLKINHLTPEDTQILASLPVLVADDDELACLSACEILSSLDMRADYVLNGLDAVDRVVQAHEDGEDFSIVILDWKMPGMDGIETARRIRKVVGEEIPIVILSAFDWSEIEQEAISAGVSAFIEKPLFKSRLTHVLKAVIEANGKIEAVAQKPMGEYGSKQFEGRRILLVEDNELNAEIAQEILEMAGLSVEIAINGQKAVDKVVAAEPGYFDLIFMDIRMPVMDGYEAAAVIRASDRKDLKEIPIVAMTAEAFVEDVRRSFAVGMNGHISKPIDLDKLNHVLEKYLG